MSAGCGSLAGAELALPIGAAAPALAELRAERLAAVAGPVETRGRFPAKDFFRSRKVRVFQDPDLEDADLPRAEEILRWKPPAGLDWTCDCGETLGAQFSQCWRCGAYRKG